MNDELLVEKLTTLEQRHREMIDELGNPELIADTQKYRERARSFREVGEIVAKFEEFKKLDYSVRETRTLLSDSGNDPEMKAMAEEELASLEERLDRCRQEVKIRLLPKDPNDERNVMIEIRAGTGGDEATLFAADVFRMYARYAEQMGWKVEIMSSNPTGVGGFKEIIVLVEGKGVYSQLKYESGVHRVQRVPATETSGRLHTSAVTVAVLPEADEVEINIQGKRPSNRHVLFVRSGRSKRQHDVLGRPNHPHSVESGCLLPG